MLEDFQNPNLTQFNFSIGAILINLLVALACGIIIAMVYRYTYKGTGYSSSFVSSLILLSIITSVVIMTIGNNLATAFGLVGAMSIIRFRTAVRDVQDIVFIFFSLSIGLAAGVGFKEVALLGTIFISLVIIVVIKSKLTHPHKALYLLKVRYRERGDTDEILSKTIKKYCREMKLVNLQTVEPENWIDAFYHVTLKSKMKHGDFISDLKKIEGLGDVNLFFDEEDAPMT